ncbi:hypothetical protein GCM10010277_76660 [Streptomyces longisporoflavus]|nr:hypothetical protein GCM10010277_76660 [Streptomyces longisporoflavus]
MPSQDFPLCHHRGNPAPTAARIGRFTLNCVGWGRTEAAGDGRAVEGGGGDGSVRAEEAQASTLRRDHLRPSPPPFVRAGPLTTLSDRDDSSPGAGWIGFCRPRPRILTRKRCE